MTGEALVGQEGLQAVLPLGSGGLWPWKQRTQIMAILNLTPDSFSDGGQVAVLPKTLKNLPAACSGVSQRQLCAFNG